MRIRALLIILFIACFIAACAPKQQTVAFTPETSENTTVASSATPTQSETETPASLSDVNGTVFVNSILASQGLPLKEGDVVKTGKDSTAEISLYDSSVIRLQPDSQIALTGLSTSADNRSVTITQELGETWSRVLRVSGITNYQVDTPNTVATVRGTGFKVTVDENKTWVGVGEGLLHFEEVENGSIASELDVEENQQADVMRPGKRLALGLKRIELKNLTDESVVRELRKDERVIERARDRFEKKHPELAKELNQSGLTPEQSKAYLRSLVAGNLSTEARKRLSNESMRKLAKEHIDLIPDSEKRNATARVRLAFNETNSTALKQQLIRQLNETARLGNQTRPPVIAASKAIPIEVLARLRGKSDLPLPSPTKRVI